jgi:hypothetical protein
MMGLIEAALEGCEVIDHQTVRLRPAFLAPELSSSEMSETGAIEL